MTIDDLYQAIGKAVLGGCPNDDDALALMVLLHTYHLQLTDDVVLTDRPGISDLAAITQRHAAEVIAGAWPDRADRDRVSREHWYYEFNVRSPFELAESILPEWTPRVERVRTQLISSGLVLSVKPED
jgi:hypothetical protein